MKKLVTIAAATGAMAAAAAMPAVSSANPGGGNGNGTTCVYEFNPQPTGPEFLAELFVGNSNTPQKLFATNKPPANCVFLG